MQVDTNEKADRIHGRLLESVHISGYTFERACAELEWLIDDDHWKELSGVETFQDFLGTIDLSPFKMDAPSRRRLAQKMAEKEASQRAIAAAIGVSQPTIHNDLNPPDKYLSDETRPHEEADGEDDNFLSDPTSVSDAPAPPTPLSPPDTIATKWTGDIEGYTPAEYVEAARRAMGSITTDPATTAKAQAVIQAETFYTMEDDGLQQTWRGNVFLNPPYRHPDIRQFIDKLLAELDSGNVEQAILLTNNNTDTYWFHDCGQRAALICFTKGRINFYKPDDSVTSPTNGQAFFYFGKDAGRFAEEFSSLGLIAKRYDPAKDC